MTGGDTSSANLNEYRGRGGGILNEGGIVTLNNSTITGNKSDSGGGIFNDQGTVTLNNSAVTDNISNEIDTAYDDEGGGGIFNYQGTVTLNNSAVTGNFAGINGGGIYSYGGTMTLNNSTVNDNIADSEILGGDPYGGGIYNRYSTITLNNSSVSGNSARSAGGIYNLGASATLTLSNSTVSGNTATSEKGGGIAIGYGSTVTLDNSTVSGNYAFWGGGGIFIYSSYNTLTLNNSTVSGNTADDGGGIYVYYRSSSTITLNRSVISGNDATRGAEIYNGIYYNNGDENIIGNNYNVIGYGGKARSHGFTPTTVPYGGTDVIPTEEYLNEVLLGLADNGGPTLTHALADGSPAIDLIPNTDDACDPGESTDQRGAVRADGINRGGSACDAGAFEYASTPPAVPAIVSTPVTAVHTQQPYQYVVQATGYPTPTFSLTTFPAGMTIDAGSGLISWTPDHDGVFPVKVEASSSAGTAVQNFDIIVSNYTVFLPVIIR
ncbi:MAG: hypothetical protein GY796_15310 [Chloroflexi bacterium]|nr:hypothetical protein [Chloroflexota bacterium]